MSIFTVLICSIETILGVGEHAPQLVDLTLVLILHLHADFIDALCTTLGYGTSAFQLSDTCDSTFIFPSCNQQFSLVFRYFVQ